MANIAPMNLSAAVSKLVLLPDPRPIASNPRGRRYRLGRIDVNPSSEPGPDRFAHLKRTYD